LQKQLEAYNLIVVGYHSIDLRAKYNFGVDSTVTAFINGLSLHKKVILDFFGTPYGLAKFGDSQQLAAIIVSYENTKYSEERSAQLIFGGIAAQGTLPVSVDSMWHFGNGVWQESPTRLHYVMPEETGISQLQLSAIDTLIMQAIRQKATPGAQIIAIHKGNVFYNKTFGRHTYEKNAPPVRPDDVYDWASITKIGATLPVIMHLTEKKQLSLNATLSDYIPHLASTNKKAITITELLTHTSGLQAYQPLYK
jgi:CubicO group peptidase (beta-lactamase class C family)